MPRGRKSPDLVGLTVLALLSVRAGHPYELHRMIVDTHKDFVTGLPRSLYHAVDRLARDELIRPARTAKEGNRPERTVYEITDEGRAELSSRLRRLLEEPTLDVESFLAAVSLIGCLPEDDVDQSLRTRAATLEGLVMSAETHLTELAATGLPRVLLLEVECDRAHRLAELAWIRDVLARLGTGELAWTADHPPAPPPALVEGGPTD